MIYIKRLFIFLLLVSFFSPVSALAVSVGEAAPDFSLETLDGQTVSLSDFAGKVVLLKLATTWCPTCRKLSKEIETAGDFLAEKDAVFLEVFVQDSPDMINRYLEDKNFSMTFHALIDDGQAYRAYNVYLIPRLLVVDPEGLVTFDSAGQNVTADQLRELVGAASPVSEAPEVKGQEQVDEKEAQ